MPVAQFQAGLEDRCGVMARSFGTRVKNTTARYYPVFATHDERGLECWNQMVWKLDEVTGRGASAGSLGQLSLFDEPFVQPLRMQLEQLGPGEVSFSRLVSLDTRAGFKPTHVRKP